MYSPEPPLYPREMTFRVSATQDGNREFTSEFDLPDTTSPAFPRIEVNQPTTTTQSERKARAQIRVVAPTTMNSNNWQLFACARHACGLTSIRQGTIAILLLRVRGVLSIALYTLNVAQAAEPPSPR